MYRTLVPCLFCFTLACADGPDGESLAHQIDDAREHVDALRTQLEAHTAAAQAASDLVTLQALEQPHGGMVREHMEALGHAIGDMDMCDGAPDDDVDSMMQMHEMCDAEQDRHARAIAAATDLAAALAEEDLHRTTMMDRLDDLDGMGDAMMDGYGGMMCGGHHGMDDHEAP
jgi:hypothetical protein